MTRPVTEGSGSPGVTAARLVTARTVAAAGVVQGGEADLGPHRKRENTHEWWIGFAKGHGHHVVRKEYKH